MSRSISPHCDLRSDLAKALAIWSARIAIAEIYANVGGVDRRPESSLQNCTRKEPTTCTKTLIKTTKAT